MGRYLRCLGRFGVKFVKKSSGMSCLSPAHITLVKVFAIMGRTQGKKI